MFSSALFNRDRLTDPYCLVESLRFYEWLGAWMVPRLVDCIFATALEIPPRACDFIGIFALMLSLTWLVYILEDGRER